MTVAIRVLSVLVYFLFQTSIAVAQSDVDTLGQSKRLIFVCSGLPSLDAERLESFYTHAFPERTPPLILNGSPISSEEKTDFLFFFVSSLPINEAAMACLMETSLLTPRFRAQVIAQTSLIGTVPPFLANQHFGKYYEPIKAIWRYYREGKRLFVSFLSAESNDYARNHALTGIFGLEMDACDSNPACETLKPKQ